MRFHSLQIVALLGSLAVGVAARAADAVPPADAGAAAATPLQAIFMEVDGKVRWRPDEKAAWKEAAVNDLVSAGAEIRTGLKGRATLRVGRNATVLVDSGTSFEIPEMVQEGETLRTLAAVKTGRVDFKVDKVGYANDFKVATPQTTLSVRGTGFAVNSGQLNGVEVVGARTNMINAIEVKYVASNLKYFMSGGAASSSSNPDPVKSAWMSSLGPPQVAGLIADKGQLEQMAAQGQAGNAPTNPQQAQQIAAAEAQQQQAQEDPQLARLLDLQNSDFKQVKALAKALIDDTGTPVEGGSTREAIEAVHPAVALRNASIASLYDVREDLQDQHDALQQLVDDSEDDVTAMAALRTQLDAAVLDEDEARGEQGVIDALDAMGELDDDWQGELRAQSLALVASIQSLSDDLQDAGSDASTKDAAYNALRDTAQGRLTALGTTTDSLEALRGSIAGYQRAAAAVIRGGKVSDSALKSLERSLQILDGTAERIAAALASLDAATARLAEAGAIADQEGTLAAALLAVQQGLDLNLLSPTLQAAIDQNIEAIEAARFSAFFAAATAGVAAIDDKRDLAIEQQGVTIVRADAANAKVDAMELQVPQVQLLAAQMDTFWNGAGGGDENSPKARMEQLLELSQDDRDAMASMLVALGERIAADDEVGATQQIESMRSKDAVWNDSSTGLMLEVGLIDDEMQARFGDVQAAFDATVQLQGDYQSLLAAADASRDLSAGAVARIEALRDRLAQYQEQYEQLLQQGRGGADGISQVAAAGALLTGTLAKYEAALAASSDAAAKAEIARSNGARVLLAAEAASIARQAAVDLATASTTLRDEIQANVDLMGQDLLTGEGNYSGAFGGGDGGGDGGGGGGPPG